MDIHSRRKHHVDTVFAGLPAYRCSRLTYQIRVPGTREERSHRESRGVESLVRPFAGSIDMHPCRAVGKDDSRNAQSFNRFGATRRPRDAGRCSSGHAVLVGFHGAADKQLNLFLQSHGPENFVDVVFSKPRLCKCCGEDCQRCKSGQYSFHRIINFMSKPISRPTVKRSGQSPPKRLFEPLLS